MPPLPTGYHHVCEFRTELGIRGGRPGALAEQLAFPARYLHALPDTVTDAAGALVEPGGNAWRSVEAAGLREGDRVLILGPGTIGLLCAMFARAVGAEVHLMGRPGRSLEFASTFEFDGVWTEHDLPSLRWDAVIDSSNAPRLPAKALRARGAGQAHRARGARRQPEPHRHAHARARRRHCRRHPRRLAGLAPTISSYASGTVDPTPLIAATVTLEELAGVLAGDRPAGAAAGPKIHVEISRPSGGIRGSSR